MLKKGHGGEATFEVTIANATQLLIDGPFTNKGLTSLTGLDGVFGLAALH